MLGNVVDNLALIALGLLIVSVCVMIVAATAIIIKLVIAYWRDA